MHICKKCQYWKVPFDDSSYCNKRIEENKNFDPVNGWYYEIADPHILNKYGECPYFKQKVSIFKKLLFWRDR